MKLKYMLMNLLVVTLFLSSCEKDTLLKSGLPSYDDKQTIITYIKGAEQHKLLHDVLVKVGYEEVLAGGEFTFFIPQDQVLKEYLQAKGLSDFSTVETAELKKFKIKQLGD